MIVVDTSAVIAALAARPQIDGLVGRLSGDGNLHAIHALRRLVTSGDLAQERAEEVRSIFANLVITRYPHQPLADRMWQLRSNLSAYDAAFVALAEALGVPLVTCDGRLSRASGHQARIELFRGSS